MLQLMALMFGPYYLLGINMGSGWKFGACAIGFILNYAAYFAEIYRSGIQSIPVGHYEAAEVLGYSRAQTFFYLVLPQVHKRILPAMGNRDHNAGQGHLACIRAWHRRDVYRGQGACRVVREHDPLRNRRGHILDLHARRRVRLEQGREETRVLP